MLLRGSSPAGIPALSFVNTPTGGLVGYQTGPQGPGGSPVDDVQLDGDDINFYVLGEIIGTLSVMTLMEAVIDGAPGALDTLNELAAALGDDPNFATTILAAIGAKSRLSVDGSFVSTYDIDTTALTAADVDAYTDTETDAAIIAALLTPVVNSIKDSNGNKLLDFLLTASAVNNLRIVNNAAGGAPQLIAVGTDTNISVFIGPKNAGHLVVTVPTGQTPTVRAAGSDTDHNLNLVSKNAGVVQANGVPVLTTTGTQTLTNKTIGADQVADGSTNKTYTATEKTKLAGIATGATANDTDANLKSRANHTGTQTASTISDLSVDTERNIELTSGESTISRRTVISTAVNTGNGSLRLTYFTARKTETINSVRALCGGSAMVGATLCRIGIYSEDGSGNLTLVASTASDTALFASTSTAYTKALQAGWSKVRGTRYAIGVLVVGSSTPPTLLGHTALLASEAGMAARMGGLVGGQTDLPSSVLVGSISDQANLAYVAMVP